MRLLALLPLVFVLLVTTAATGATKKPTLTVKTTKPLVVVGTGFEAGETIRVVALGHGGKRARTLVAGPRGGFKVALPARTTIGCAPTIVTATGSGGSKATLTARAGCVTTPPPRD